MPRMGLGAIGRWSELHRPSLAVAAVVVVLVVELAVGCGAGKVSPNKIKPPWSHPFIRHPNRRLHLLHPRILHLAFTRHPNCHLHLLHPHILHLASHRSRHTISCTLTITQICQHLNPDKSPPKSFKSSPPPAVLATTPGGILCGKRTATCSRSRTTSARTTAAPKSSPPSPAVSATTKLRPTASRSRSTPCSLRSPVNAAALPCGAHLGWRASFFNGSVAAVQVCSWPHASCSPSQVSSLTKGGSDGLFHTVDSSWQLAIKVIFNNLRCATNNLFLHKHQLEARRFKVERQASISDYISCTLFGSEHGSGNASIDIRADLRLWSMLVLRFHVGKSETIFLSPVKHNQYLRLKIHNPRRHRPIRLPRGAPVVLSECNIEDPRCFWRGQISTQRPRWRHHLCLLHMKCRFWRSRPSYSLENLSYLSHLVDALVVAQKLQTCLGWMIPNPCTQFPIV